MRGQTPEGGKWQVQAEATMQIVRRAGGARLRGSCEAYLGKIHGEVSSWPRGADAGGERGAGPSREGLARC